MRKAYFGSDGSQIHFRHWTALQQSGNAPLILLPPAPHSGLFFESIAQKLCQNCEVYAVDYPGYGGSDALPGSPSLTAYAKSLIPFIATLGQVHCLGFHTGALVATELAILQPAVLSSLLLIDVPNFNIEKRAAFAATLPDDAIPDDLQTAYDKAVLSASDKPRARAFDLWVESQRAQPRHNDAFRAAFAYDCASRFANIPSEIRSHIHICGTNSALFEPSQRSSREIEGAHFHDWHHLSAPVFEREDSSVAEDIIAILS